MASDKPDLNQDQGFVRKPFAIRKIVQSPDGTMQVFYVDSRTGKQVNPKGYTVITADQTPDTTQVKETDNVSKPEKEKNSATDLVMGAQHSRNDSPGLAAATSGAPQSMSDGYGYTNKPGWMGFTGMLPGPLGTVGKLANVAVNASNTEAVNDQREALGFADNSMAKNIGSAMFDQKGYIGEASITKSDGTKSVAPVGFEGEDSVGRTTMTPEEARRRTLISGNLDEATPEEKATAIGEFKADNPDNSFFGKIQEATSGFFGNIFGTKKAPTTSPSNFSTSGLDSNGFPSKPDKPTNYSGSPDDRDGTSPDTGDGDNAGYDSPGLF